MSKELYDKLTDAPIWLEPESHVYIDKITKQRYTSVTTTLSRYKPKMPHDIKDTIHKQYVKLFAWYAINVKENEISLQRFIYLYINYNYHRSFQVKKWEGKKYNSYKKIQFYDLPSFLEEFEYLESIVVTPRKKSLYINSDSSIMETTEIQAFWDTLTKLANLYGEIVHATIERELIFVAYLLKKRHLQTYIEELSLELSQLVIFAKSKYSNQSKIFDEYIILNLNDFQKMIVKSFKSLDLDWGRITIPEKMVVLKTHFLAGMTDLYSDICDVYFDLGDHKTNKVFSYPNEDSNHWYVPFDHLTDESFDVYSLQMSIYATIIMMTTGKKLRNLWVSYYNRLTGEFTKIDIPFLYEEAKTIIELHKINVLKNREKYANHPLTADVDPNYIDVLLSILEKNRMEDVTSGWIASATKEERTKKYTEIKNFVVNKQIEIDNDQ